MAAETNLPSRPVLRYYGGKWRIAPWILSHFPPHRIYTEAFGGGASVLIQKPRSYAEIYNDLDGEVVNVFRVLRDPDAAARLEDLVRLTPFAREEFEAAYLEFPEHPVEQARRTIVRSFMGFGSNSINGKRGMRTRASKWKPQTGFRANSNRSGTIPARDWSTWPDQIGRFVERLAGVVVENRPALEVLSQHDDPTALHYLDPPYPSSTRSSPDKYTHEMSDDEHRGLAESLRSLRGMVILSGYPCDLYDVELYPDWERFSHLSLAQGARPRTEVLWLNPVAFRAISRNATPLLSLCELAPAGQGGGDAPL